MSTTDKEYKDITIVITSFKSENKIRFCLNSIDKQCSVINVENSNDQKYKQKIDIVLKLSVGLKTVKKRILERQIQEKRADDNEEIAIKRYQTYEKSSEPVLNYYQQSNLLKVVNGETGISEINSEISVLIDAIKGWL